MHEDNYITLVKEAMNKAYVPYSNYPVGALVVTDNGNTYSGCNVENASYPEGHCAETTAIASMVMGGEKHIRMIYVMSKNDQGGCHVEAAVNAYENFLTSIRKLSCVPLMAYNSAYFLLTCCLIHLVQSICYESG